MVSAVRLACPVGLVGVCARVGLDTGDRSRPPMMARLRVHAFVGCQLWVRSMQGPATLWRHRVRNGCAVRSIVKVRTASRRRDGVEGRVVTEVEVDVPIQRTVGVQDGPATAARGRCVVVALPGELHCRPIVARSLAAVQLAVDRDEAELTQSVIADHSGKMVPDEAGRCPPLCMEGD